jgi:hypothetical protein
MEKLIEELQKLPDGLDVHVFDRRKNLGDDIIGDGGSIGVLDFDVEHMPLAAAYEQQQFYEERHGHPFKLWIALSFSNDDYDNGGQSLLVSASASFDEVKRIWNASENHIMHELGEICKGDAAYCENVPDLETYFKQHYR